MPTPQWPDTLLPSRATRRRIRLRQDFEDSVLASDLDEEDVSLQPTQVPARPPAMAGPVPPVARVIAAVPLDSDEARFRREQLLRSLPPPPPFQHPAPPQAGRPELWAEPAPEDAPGVLGRLARIASIGGVVVVSALLLTKGLAEMVWELVAR